MKGNENTIRQKIEPYAKNIRTFLDEKKEDILLERLKVLGVEVNPEVEIVQVLKDAAIEFIRQFPIIEYSNTTIRKIVGYPTRRSQKRGNNVKKLYLEAMKRGIRKPPIDMNIFYAITKESKELAEISIEGEREFSTTPITHSEEQLRQVEEFLRQYFPRAQILRETDEQMKNQLGSLTRLANKTPDLLILMENGEQLFVEFKDWRHFLSRELVIKPAIQVLSYALMGSGCILITTTNTETIWDKLLNRTVNVNQLKEIIEQYKERYVKEKQELERELEKTKQEIKRALTKIARREKIFIDMIAIAVVNSKYTREIGIVSSELLATRKILDLIEEYSEVELRVMNLNANTVKLVSSKENVRWIYLAKEKAELIGDSQENVKEK